MTQKWTSSWICCNWWCFVWLSHNKQTTYYQTQITARKEFEWADYHLQIIVSFTIFPKKRVPYSRFKGLEMIRSGRNARRMRTPVDFKHWRQQTSKKLVWSCSSKWTLGFQFLYWFHPMTLYPSTYPSKPQAITWCQTLFALLQPFKKPPPPSTAKSTMLTMTWAGSSVTRAGPGTNIFVLLLPAKNNSCKILLYCLA